MTLAAKLANDEKAQAHTYTTVASTNEDEVPTMLGKLRTRLMGSTTQTDRRAQTKDFLARHNMAPSGSVVVPAFGEQMLRNPCAPLPPSSTETAASHAANVQRLHQLDRHASPAPKQSEPEQHNPGQHPHHAKSGRNLASAGSRLSDMWDIAHGVSPGAHGRIPSREAPASRKAPPPHRQQGLLLETLEEFRNRTR